MSNAVAKRNEDGGVLVRLARKVDSFVNSLTGMGGAFDKSQATRPNTTRTPLTRAEIDSLYEFNGYAARYVDRHAEEATRPGWEVEDDTDTPSPMSDEDERLNVVSVFEEGLKWARKDGGAVIFPIVDDGEEDLSKPLNLNRVRSVKNLVVLEKYEATPVAYDGDIESPNFCGVLYWNIHPNKPGFYTTERRQTNRVHFSRIIYLPGRKLPRSRKQKYGGYDQSVLDSVWDKLRELETADHSGALLMQDIKTDILKVEGLAEISVSDQEEYLEMRAKLIAKQRSLLGILLLGEGETYETKTANITGYADLHDRARQSFAAVCDTPQTIMFGTAPSGLNTDGESSRKNFDKSVARYRMQVVNDPLRKLYFILYAAKKGPAKGRLPERLKVVFGPLETLSAMEQAELEHKHAETDKIRVEWGFVTAEHVTRSRYSDRGYRNRLQPMQDEDIEDMAMSKEAEAELMKQVEDLTAKVKEYEGAAGGEGEDTPPAGEGEEGAGGDPGSSTDPDEEEGGGESA